MQTLLGDLSLRRGRVHEFCGPARRVLAAMVMAASSGSVIWIQPGWQAERLFPDGLRDFADPGRVIFATARRPEDLLWSMEEVLRSGAVSLVIADLPGAPGLTPIRRLHLAAETGAEAARPHRPPPLGLLLTPGEGGAQGVESRWHLAPVLAPGPGMGQDLPPAAWRLGRLRARMAPPMHWRILRDDEGGLDLTPETLATAPDLPP